MRTLALSLLSALALASGCTPSSDPDACQGITCLGHGLCQPETGACACEPGFAGEACEACAAGWEARDGGCACPAGRRPFRGRCVPTGCEIPLGPALSEIHAGAELVFSTSSGAALEVGASDDPQAAEPATWLAGDRLAMPAVESPRPIVVFARQAAGECRDGPWYRAELRLAPTYPGPAGAEDSTAIAADDPALVAWANGWIEPVAWGEELDEQWQEPERALGPAEGDGLSVVSLGRGGALVVTFARPIADGPGADLAVFENGVSDGFLELAWVEVSSDGRHFVRFDGVQLDGQPVAAYGALDTRSIGGLAGKYRQGFGQPFDLAALANRPEVLAGQLDLGAVAFVRLVDVVGDGSQRDCFGQPIFDPYPTTSSAGFDLDAVGVLHAAE